MKKFGFTMIELMGVIILITLIMGIALPQFWFTERPGTKELKHLTRVITMLRNEAILGQNTYFLVFDLEKQSLHVERQLKEGGRLEVDRPAILRPYPFDSDFPLKRLLLSTNPQIIPDLNATTFAPIRVQIDSSGFVDPFTLYFMPEPEDVWRIQTRGVTGVLEIREGVVSIESTSLE